VRIASKPDGAPDQARAAPAACGEQPAHSAAHVELDFVQAEAARQFRRRRRLGLEAEHPAATGAAEMDVIGMLALRAGGGETEHAARIHRLQRQAAGHQRIEDAVERDAVHGGFRRRAELRLEFGMAQRLARRMQRLQHAHPPRVTLTPAARIRSAGVGRNGCAGHGG
jgi:hypothetical protein